MKVRAELSGAEYGARRAGRIPAGAKRATRAAVTKIVRGVASEAKAIVRRRSGLLSKSLGSVVRTYRTETTVGVAGPRRGFAVTITAVNGGRRITAIGTNAAGKAIKLSGRAKLGDRKSATRYAHLVEKKFPFLAPAAAKANRTAKAEIVGSIDAAIRQTQ